jgi:prepilin-type N-terminal cleavage/methylation domain-containing protein
MSVNSSARKGFSLIELVIVIVIIGIIAAIAIPRMSRGAEGANDAALKANLSVLRSALDLYKEEHAGTYPNGADGAAVKNQLVQYTNDSGGVSASSSSTHIYGPYLREVPKMPAKGAGLNKDLISLVTGTTPPSTEITSGGIGWQYNATLGNIWANSTSTDKSGTQYITY